jgi:hypothetical protein
MVDWVDIVPWKRFCSGKKARRDEPGMLILQFCFWTHLFPASVTESSNRVLGLLDGHGTALFISVFTLLVLERMTGEMNQGC